MEFEYPLTAWPCHFWNGHDPMIKAMPTSSPGDFDFLLGHHTVRHKRLKERLNNCAEWIDLPGTKVTEPLLGGIGNIEKHKLEVQRQTVDAIALRLFNKATHLWSLYWADSINGTLDPPLQGSFHGNLGVFFGTDRHEGQLVRVQFQYDRTDPDHPVWGQAFSADDGHSWEWNWFMFFSKCAPSIDIKNDQRGAAE